MIYDISETNGFSAQDGSMMDEADVDPMSMVANVVDAMLVLAVGLMVAIVAFWNLDLPTMQEVLKQNEVTAVDDIERISEQIQAEGQGYTALGTVYQDPTTGQLYMLTEEVEGALQNGSSDDASADEGQG